MSSQSEMFSFAHAHPGKQFKIHALGDHNEACARLRELGFCENAVIRCLQIGYGTIICEVCSTRFGIDSHTASLISVTDV